MEVVDYQTIENYLAQRIEEYRSIQEKSSGMSSIIAKMVGNELLVTYGFMERIKKTIKQNENEVSKDNELQKDDGGR